MKKGIIISVITVFLMFVLFAAAYLIYTWPIKIDTKLKGVMYRVGDTEYSEDMTLIIDGHYSRSLFKGDDFIGGFYIEGLEIGDNIDVTNAAISFDSISGGKLYYFDNELSNGSGIITLESVFMDKKGSGVVINIYDNFMSNIKTWNSGDGLVFAAPADNRTQAVELTNELMGDTLSEDIE